jgi:hypothetical protein
MSLSANIQHTFYENGIPAEIEQKLVALYHSAFCVKEYFEQHQSSKGFNVLVMYCDSADPVHIIVYRKTDNAVTVLNELVSIEQEYLEYVAAALFRKYPDIAAVHINRLKSRISKSDFPWRLWEISHDITVALPQSFDEYHGQLGRQTQKHIKYYINRLQREQGGFEFQVAVSREIEATSISRIIELNRMRMKDKNIRSGYDSLFEKRISAFCRSYGVVSTVSIGGRIIAGAICYEVGSHAYLETIAHDPDFNKYNAGQVCLYLTIKCMIERGRSSFHMLWGENEYKYRFLGEKQDLYFVSIYRSGTAKLMSMPKLMQHTYSRAVRQVSYLTNKYVINRFR